LGDAKHLWQFRLRKNILHFTFKTHTKKMKRLTIGHHLSWDGKVAAEQPDRLYQRLNRNVRAKGRRQSRLYKLVSAGNHILPEIPDNPDSPDIPETKVSTPEEIQYKRAPI